jgi:cyclophilin family peptidyl-prolyl cis-trans isomerase
MRTKKPASSLRGAIIALLLFPCTSTLLLAATAAKPASKASVLTYSQVLEQSQPSDWRTPVPENIVYMELASGRVVIELAPHVAPKSTDNVRKLIRENYFDGLAIIRSQDNYVVQWGDADEKNPRAIKSVEKTLAPEFTRTLSAAEARKFAFDRLPDRDGYAPEVGFASGFWAGRDSKKSQVWLAHCYGALGVGRDNASDSGNGAELYVVTGHAPRHLDKNITLVGRVLQGMSLLSTLPRGTKPLGFYATPDEFVAIKSIRLAADVPEKERTSLEVIRTDTPLFKRAVAALRNRGRGDPNAWYKVPAGHVELCNVPIAVREKK